MLTRAGTRSFTTGQGFLRRPSFTSSGRFFAFRRDASDHGVWTDAQVVDQVTGRVETLPQGGGGDSPQLSGDGRLIVSVSTSTGRGWFEYTAD